MLCAMNGHQRTARTLALRLTKFDLDIDLRDNEGFTALLFAIKSQNYDIAHDLIRFGSKGFSFFYELFTACLYLLTFHRCFALME